MMTDVTTFLSTAEVCVCFHGNSTFVHCFCKAVLALFGNIPRP
uniref:Uncharacterized protein n=1 Tax=Anguilla anguilla TaxID=7936 RepID=A0A0E9VE40_ANGAN